MSFPGQPPIREGERNDEQTQETWPAATHPFEKRSFDSLSSEPVHGTNVPPRIERQTPIGRENEAGPPHQHKWHNSLGTSPPISDEPFVLDDSLASPPSHYYFRKGATVATPAHDGDLHGADDPLTSSTPEDSYRKALPGEITPYLGLRARLTQIPMNRWTVLLLLVLARLIILFESLHTNLEDAQQEASSACAKVEELGSAMASIPHYASPGVNELVAARITDTVRALMSIAMLILSGILEIIMFMIERTYGTIVCVADAIVDAIIQIALIALNDLVSLVKSAVDTLVSGALNAVGDLLHVAQVIPGLNGPTSKIQNELNKFKNGDYMDTSAMTQSINNFEKMIPDFKQIENDVKAVVGLPFTTVQTLFNESFGNWSMDPAVFPIASKETLTFCTGNDAITNLFDILFIVTNSAKIIAIAGLLIATFLAAAFMLWTEIQRYRGTVVQVRSRFLLRGREPMDTIYVASRPLTAKTGLWISTKVTKDPDRKMLIRWIVAYATTYTALFVLSLAVAGAFSVLGQYVIIRAIKKETPDIAQEVGTFVANTMGVLGGSSMRWANESNQAILKVQNELNDHVLIYIKNATGSVVDMINSFESKAHETLTAAFGSSDIGQDVDKFVEGLLACVITNALDRIKAGIEFIHRESQVAFPEFPTDIFSLGAAGSGNSSLTVLLTNSVNQTANEVTTTLNKIVITLQSGMIQEIVIALVLLLVYVTYVLMAAAQAALRLTCLRERKPVEDSENRAGVEKPGHARTSVLSEVGMPKTPGRASVAPSYRLSNPDVSQMALDLSVVMPASRAPGERSTEEHGTPQAMQSPEAGKNPFGDDTYAIGDDEVDSIVCAMRHSGEIAEDSRAGSSRSLDHNLYAMGDEEVDGIVGVLRESVDVVDAPRAHDRHD